MTANTRVQRRVDRWLGRSASAESLRRFRAPAGGTVLAVAVAIVALAGWSLGIEVLTTLVPGAMPIRPITAICLLLIGSSILVLRQQRAVVHAAGRPLAAAAGALATVVLAGGIADWIARPGAELGEWGGMAPSSAACVLLLSVAILAATARPMHRLTYAAVIGAACIGALVSFSTLFSGVPPLVLLGAARMSPITALLALALAWDTLGLLGDQSPMAALRGDNPSAILARRLLLPAVALPILVAALRVRGEAHGLYDSRFGSALMLVATIAPLAVVLVAAAAKGRQLERESAQAHAERDRFFDLSLDLMATVAPDGRFLRLNPAWTATLGHSAVTFRERPFTDLVHPDDREATRYEMHRMFGEGKSLLSFQNRCAHADGSYRWLDWSAQPSSDRSVVYAVVRDVTVQKAEELRLTERAAALAVRNERLADRAVRDPLTRLHNRAYLDSALAKIDNERRSADAGAPLAAI
ncbi:MAG TPA: PAS domain S-box protein, partial [Candidatus Limnocylindria bacterium]|nr:PAS domain S-box protein [Candidatus Limnocylindria bacterium]